MSTHIESRFQKPVVVNGVTEWHDIHARFDNPQNYDLFAWLAGVCNYNNIKPIAEMRGAPEDMKLSYEDRCMDISPCHWLYGTEILEGMYDFEPVTERGVVGNWTKRTKGEPDGYSHHISDQAFKADSDVVKHDSGYAANLWEAKCNHHRIDYKCSPMRTESGGGRLRFIANKERPSVERHLAKLSKYLKRAGRYSYVKEWVITPDDRRKEFAFFTDEIRNLVQQHGQVRMVMGFA